MFGRLTRNFAQVRSAIDAAAPAAAARSGKGRLRQALEMLALRMKGFSPDDYYTLRLYERSSPASAELMSRRGFSRLRQDLNPRHVEVVPFNKWVSCIYLESLGTRVPTCYGIYQPTRGVQRNGDPLRTSDDLAAVLARCPGGAVLKPLDASHGHGVAVVTGFDAAARRVRRASGAEQSLDELLAALVDSPEGWVVQERIHQHPELERLHASSTNTARIVTICRASGQVEAIGAVLRMGTGVSEIDNTTGGGIVATIDLATGRCGPAYSRYRIEEYSTHPTSGTPIVGFRVPCWEEAKTAVVRAHRLVPFPRTLGWDVAIGADGPVILEVNSDYYYNHLQLEGPSRATKSLRSSGG